MLYGLFLDDNLIITPELELFDQPMDSKWNRFLKGTGLSEHIPLKHEVLVKLPCLPEDAHFYDFRDFQRLHPCIFKDENMAENARYQFVENAKHTLRTHPGVDEKARAMMTRVLEDVSVEDISKKYPNLARQMERRG